MAYIAPVPVAGDLVSDEISFQSPNAKQTIVSVTSATTNGQLFYTIVGSATTFIVSTYYLVLEYVKQSGQQKWVVGK